MDKGYELAIQDLPYLVCNLSTSNFFLRLCASSVWLSANVLNVHLKQPSQIKRSYKHASMPLFVTFRSVCIPVRICVCVRLTSCAHKAPLVWREQSCSGSEWERSARAERHGLTFTHRRDIILGERYQVFKHIISGEKKNRQKTGFIDGPKMKGLPGSTFREFGITRLPLWHCLSCADFSLWAVSSSVHLVVAHLGTSLRESCTAYLHRFLSGKYVVSIWIPQLITHCSIVFIFIFLHIKCCFCRVGIFSSSKSTCHVDVWRRHWLQIKAVMA